MVHIAVDGYIKASPALVDIYQFPKISDWAGLFTAVLDTYDYFGSSVAVIGDVDGDGVRDLAVGARQDDDGSTDRGAVYILFMEATDLVASFQKISDTEGSFTWTLDNSDWFGWSVASIGDLDSDGVVDIVAGAWYDDDGGTDRGALYVLFLRTNGTVASAQKISSLEGSFTAVLVNSDYFGSSVASLGDLDSDGVADLVVGAAADDDSAAGDSGAVYVLFMRVNGTVGSFQKISNLYGSFGAGLDSSDWFGWSVGTIGDLDGDGVVDVAVGAYYDDDGFGDAGAVYLLFLQTDGTVGSYRKISATFGSFTGVLASSDYFGSSVAGVGDVNSDGVLDLAVGASRDDDGTSDAGALYVLFLTAGGSVSSFDKVSADTSSALGSALSTASDYFGWSVACSGEVDSAGRVELIVGAWSDDDGSTDRGAVYLLSYETVIAAGFVCLSYFTCFYPLFIHMSSYYSGPL